MPNLPQLSDAFWGWATAALTTLLTIAATVRSIMRDDRAAKYSELVDLRNRVDQLGQAFTKVQDENALLRRYSGHLQFLLALSGKKFPTLEQFAESETSERKKKDADTNTD